MSKVLPYIQEYKYDVAKALTEELGTNLHGTPRLTKIIVSVGIGSHLQRSKDYSQIEKNIALLTGQKPIVKKSKKAISNFKLRQGMPVALMVTLRGKAMHGFVKKLISVVLPRVRDFRGISRKAFDGRGNYSLGLKEQTVFPEIRQDDDILIHGLQVTFSTTATTNEQGMALLKKVGLPFQDK